MVVLDFHRAEQLVELIRWINSRGWSPATSTNYSFRNSGNPLSIAISKSGIDKSIFEVADMMLIDEYGQPYPSFANLKSSAETLLHTVLYQENAEINVILHTHSIYGTILSQYYMEQGEMILEGYEVLKGIGNNKTHEVKVRLPIFPNTQDIAALSEDFRKRYKADPEMQGYLIANHGLYTWGKTIAEAKRQLEVFEFLLECEYRRMLLSK